MNLTVAPGQLRGSTAWGVLDQRGVVLFHHDRPWETIGKPLQLPPGLLRAEAVVPNTPWVAVVGIPESRGTGPLRQALQRFWVPALLLVAMAGGLAVWAARGVWVPAQALAGLLRSAGHTVIEADGGSEGLARIADSPVDLVITDLGMPAVSGWEVARASRQSQPGVPVVLLNSPGHMTNDHSSNPKGFAH